jgi:oxaloacetate decarboxylase alpha subunit
MKLWVSLQGGRDAEVEFTTEGGRLYLTVEGRRLEADFHHLPDGEVYSLIVDGRSHEVRVAPLGEALDVSLHGASMEVEVRHPLEKLIAQQQQAATAGRGEIVAAPMPGLVVALRVGPGDRVVPGQPVAIVEAMKMQNELVARHGGVVSEVLVSERQTVSAGQALVRIRAAGA